MSMRKCTECGKTISTKAGTCPHCGATYRKTSPVAWLGLVVVAVAVYSVVSTDQPAVDAAKQATVAPKRLSEADCMKSLHCWGERYLIPATSACTPMVEREAMYGAEWTDGAFDLKFPSYQWENQANGVITYAGDRIKIQNAHGAWVNHVYLCEYSPSTSEVLAVHVAPGRLPD